MILQAIDQGAGPPVCLLHGLFGRAQNFGALARRLAVRHRVLSMDMRNHGASPHAAGMAYADMAADVLQTLEACGARPAGLLGHSMGGKVAMMAALSAPAHVSRLIVADIAPVGYTHHNAAVARAMQDLPLTPGLDRRRADAALAGAVPEAGTRAFLLQNLVPGPAPHWRIGLDEIASGMAGIEGWPELPDGARYDGPVLFIAGARSDYVQTAQWPATKALFPHAELAVLGDAGHWLHADQPGAFSQVVEAFLDR